MANLTKKQKAVEGKIDPNNHYGVAEAIGLVKSLATSKFDETVEVAINLGVDPRHADQMVRGVVNLPKGTGKDVRVAVFAKGNKAEEAKKAGAEIVGAEDLMEAMQGGDTGHRAELHLTQGLMPHARMQNALGRIALAELAQVQAGAEMRAIAIHHRRAHAGGQIHEHIAQTQHQPIGQGVALGGTHQTNNGNLLGFTTELNCNFFMSHNHSFCIIIVI